MYLHISDIQHTYMYDVYIIIQYTYLLCPDFSLGFKITGRKKVKGYALFHFLQ